MKKKATQFHFTPTIAGNFCQPCSSSTHNCCTTCMTRTTTSVSTAQPLIFLLGILAASVARANILVSASSCKQSKYGCKDQESIQSSTTPDPEYQWESDKLTVDTTTESQEDSPFPAGDHKVHIYRRAQRHSKHKTEQKT